MNKQKVIIMKVPPPTSIGTTKAKEMVLAGNTLKIISKDYLGSSH